jgi:CDP-diacylglycerol--glycerol-3-phosphate 3-phosphatidyltransferase
MANALTTVRLLLVYPFWVCMAAPDARHAGLAALILVVAIATDLLDGPVARRRGTVSPAGQLLDHTADVLFVTSGLAASAARGDLPWILPALVGAAFVQYVVDSHGTRRVPRLRPSRLGRYNGVVYFLPLGGDILVRLGLRELRPFVRALVWLLIASTLVSMGDRLLVTVRGRRRAARASPGGERGARPLR